MKRSIFNIIFFLSIFFIALKSFASDFPGELSQYDEQLRKIEMELLTKYKVDKDFSRKVLKSIRFQNKILDIMSNAPERKDTWSQYKKRYLTKDRINNGILYYKNNISLLKKIESVYGVPPEILVAFLGVETNYGSYTGKIKVIDSFAILLFKESFRKLVLRAIDDPLIADAK